MNQEEIVQEEPLIRDEKEENRSDDTQQEEPEHPETEEPQKSALEEETPSKSEGEDKPQEHVKVWKEDNNGCMAFHSKGRSPKRGASPFANQPVVTQKPVQEEPVQNQDDSVIGYHFKGRTRSIPRLSEEEDQPEPEPERPISNNKWSRASEGMVEFHSRGRSRRIHAQEHEEDEPEPRKPESWGEIGPSSMHFHSKGRVVRRVVRRWNPQDYEEVTEMIPSAVEKSSTSSSMKFHSNAKRQVVRKDKQKEVIEVPSGKVYARKTDSVLEYHYRKPGDYYEFVESVPPEAEIIEVVEEEPPHGDRWSRATEGAMEFHNRGTRKRLIQIVEEDDPEEGTLSSGTEHWGEVGESSSHYHSKGRSRQRVVRKWVPLSHDYEYETSLVNKSETGSAMSFHSGSRRVIKKETAGNNEEVHYETPKGRIYKKETEGMARYHYVRPGEMPPEEELVQQPPPISVQEYVRPDGPKWSRVTDSVMEFHNTTKRHAKIQEQKENEEDEEPQPQEKLESWGEVGSSSMQFHSRGQRRGKVQRNWEALPSKKQNYQVTGIKKNDYGSASSFHSNARTVSDVSTAEENDTPPVKRPGHVIRRDSTDGSSLSFHWRGPNDEIIQEDEEEFDQESIMDHFLVNWHSCSPAAPGDTANTLFNLFLSYTDYMKEFMELSLELLREAKAYNYTDAKMVSYFVELHYFQYLLDAYMSEHNVASLMIVYDRLYDLTLTTQADLVTTFVRKNASDMITLLTEPQHSQRFQASIASIVQRTAALSATPVGRSLQIEISKATDILAANMLITEPWLFSGEDIDNAAAMLHFVKTLTSSEISILDQALSIVQNYVSVLENSRRRKLVSSDLPNSYVYMLLKTLCNNSAIGNGRTTMRSIENFACDMFIDQSAPVALSLLRFERTRALVPLTTWNK